MSNRIVSVKPAENMSLIVGFQNGKEKKYDVRMLYDFFPQMKVLEKDRKLFNSVQVDTGGYGISWNDELDIDAEEIWDNGVDTGSQIKIDLLANVGCQLTKARSEFGITQKKLSEITGIDQANISKIERGISNPSLSTLKKLAHGLGMQIKIKFVPITNSPTGSSWDELEKELFTPQEIAESEARIKAINEKINAK